MTIIATVFAGRATHVREVVGRLHSVNRLTEFPARFPIGCFVARVVL